MIDERVITLAISTFALSEGCRKAGASNKWDGSVSIITMHRTCERCGRRYTYDPSVGRFGMVCPHCGKVQKKIVPDPMNDSASVLDRVLKMFSKDKK